jgi:uncharacterized protein YgfB (UPF0149 family)
MDCQAKVKYEHIEARLLAAGVEVAPAEAHGLLCGLLCGGYPRPVDHWLEELAEDSDSDLLLREARSTLQRLASETRSDLDDPGLGFRPLLPDDEQPLVRRARALGEWCQGFLYGVGSSTKGSGGSMSAVVQEALHDFAEISRIDATEIEESEEQEDNYMEVVEFVWVAAMMIREELQPETGERK